jgi:hypothetical protein
MAYNMTKDYRRTDLRTNLFEFPYWITSGEVLGKDIYHTAEGTKAGVVFDFHVAGEIIFVEQVVFQVITEYTAGTTIEVGLGTIPAYTDTINTTVITNTDYDEYIKVDDITATTIGYYGPDTAHTSDWLAAKITGSYAAPYIITGAATTTPVITVAVINAGAVTAGVGRLHMLISRIPGI